MAGTKNLIPLNRRTKEEQKEITTKAGIASGKSRREKKTLKQLLEVLATMEVTNKKGETATRAEVIAMNVIQQAMSGNLKATELYAKLTGELTNKVDLSASDEVIKVTFGDKKK